MKKDQQESRIMDELERRRRPVIVEHARTPDQQRSEDEVMAELERRRGRASKRNTRSIVQQVAELERRAIELGVQTGDALHLRGRGAGVIMRRPTAEEVEHRRNFVSRAIEHFADSPLRRP